MHVVVTGGAGFVGSHLVRRLTQESTRTVSVLDNLHRGSVAALGDILSRINFVEGDIRDAAFVRKALRGADVVYHLAAQSSVMTADADLELTLSSNVEGTKNVLEAAVAEDVGRVVFTSSREIYGDPVDLPVPESARSNPKNTYGISKMHAEKLCRDFASRVQIAILRLANVYGPGDRDRVLPIFIQNALRGSPLRLYGGQQILDLVWIDTVVDALLKAGLESLKLWNGTPLNVGSGTGITVAELARRVVEATGSSSRIEIEQSRNIEVSRFVADVTRAKALIGLEAPLDSLFKLRQTVEAARRVV